MGTLTADVPRLAEYCQHKLPSSCRLSSIPECCACADERAHAPSYSVYIDGIGFVPRGTRWQRYCWFCKEFWENRVRASGLRPAQTRIPLVPDQDEFLERWYEFYRGFRVVKGEDGQEERVAVLGEPFRDVSPGELPRTVEEMRAGREREVVGRVEMSEVVREEEGTVPNLEDALQQLLDDAEGESTSQSPVTTRAGEAQQSMLATTTNTDAAPRSAQVMVPTGSRNREYQARRAAALRRELRRMRNGIERVIVGLRDLGENVPDHVQATARLATLGDTLDAISGVPSQDAAERAIDSFNALAQASDTTQSDRTLAAIQARVDSARQHFDEARRARDQAAAELDLADSEYQTSQRTLQQLQREQRSTENYIRLFGTREEMMAQGENYESPIGAMFSRAYERFRQAEDVRQEQRTLRRVLADEAVDEDTVAQRLAELNGRRPDVWGVPQSIPQPNPESNGDQASAEDIIEQYQNLVRTQERNIDNLGGHAFQTRNGSPTQPPAVPGQGQEYVEDTWFNEVNHMLLHLESDSFSRNPWSMAPADVRVLRDRLTTQALDDTDRAKIEEMLQSGSLLMRAGLITSRVQKRRDGGEQITFLANTTNTVEQMQNVEMMAEAFQMSARVRLMAPWLSPPQRLQMLYRLQAGQRNSEEDILTLEWMLSQSDTVEIAQRVHRDTINGAVSPEARRQIEALQRSRQALAENGDHSRESLNAQRRATSAVAGAAARLAMQAGPTALLEQMANQDPETRAAYRRLQQNGLDESTRHLPTAFRTLTLADFDSDSEDDSDKEDENQGLDAPDTGRPEPKDDEEMTIRMDCRICYTQVAEIACLPCGHLVMCKWCSEQHSPTMPHDRTRPRRATGCPVCRKNVRQKVRVFRA